MNYIEQMVAELCPNGVEFKTLGEVAEIKRGTPITKDAVTPGQIPVIAGGRTPAYYHDTHNRTGQTIVIAGSGAYAGYVSWWEQPVFVSDAFSIRPHSVLEPKYCFYWLNSRQQQLHELKSGGGVPHVYPRDVAPLRIPVPPLPIQQEIVRVLDLFMALQANLQAELVARRKQYQYYRDQLLSFEGRKDVRWGTLGEICTSITAGGDLPKNYQKGQLLPSDEFPYPIYSNGSEENALYGYTDTFRVAERAVTISARGTIGFHAVREAKFTPIVRLLVLIPNSEILTPEYLNYVLGITEIGHSGGSIPQLTVPNVRNLRIPIPPLEAQQEIVTILDKFDALVNDLSIGLPAEIAARQKQYEYYRDRLLTFPEAAPQEVAEGL